ncbi:uncharacterized protein [Venturia canescens]|uniref:uncharacterized protein n=1 Tax=Venturia canescens TaxID=32260 RepID=UPI001C9CD9D3|nr:uncharacterized protein LOC122415630 [Venturia canescens]XP_043283861.1 uncharacterized protein LOC122415630 [Venturia canescens]
MTVMLLQRFASPHTNQSPKGNEDTATSALSSTVGSGTFAQSTSPSVTSLSTPSPTPLPFLFLLESQESWEEDQEDVPSINSDNCTLPNESCPSSVDYPSRVYTRFTVLPAPGASESLIINESRLSGGGGGGGGGTSATRTNHRENKDFENENVNNNFTLRNNNNNNHNNHNNNNNNNNNENNNNNNNNRRNSRNAYRGNSGTNSVIILRELEEYARGGGGGGEKLGCQLVQDKSGIQGWIAGGEAPGSGAGAPGTLGGVRDCSVGIAAAGSGSVTGGANGGGGGVCGSGSGSGRLGGQLGGQGLTSDSSTFPADSRIGGGAGAVAACTAATAASNASTCGPVAGLTRLDSQGVAMRYYRLWIYACNIVLLGSAVGFAAAVSRTLVFTGDPRRYLVPGVPRALDPTALYGYLALATQLGLVQLLGCIAARRLSAKLLNAYWMLLLALLFGDAVIGVAWVFRFGRMRAELRPSLRLRLQLEYGKDNRFSEHWDRLQRDFSCCGIAGHEDFEATNFESLPPTCCPPGSLVASNNSSDTCQQPYPRGCEDSLVDWLRKTTDLLFVLGICVIAFAKLCFLGILRYEIREMIQKIRLLREPPLPPPSAILGGSSSILCTSPPFVQSFSQLGVSPVVDSILTTATTNTHISNNNNNNNNNHNNHNNNNNNNNAGIGAGPRRTTLPVAVLPSGNSSILQHSDDYSGVRHPLLSSNLQDGGADSDTNSHCALILEETTPPSISGGCTANARPDKSNGNNNYEMREFNRRLLISNGGTPGNLNAGARNRRT